MPQVDLRPIFNPSSGSDPHLSTAADPGEKLPVHLADRSPLRRFGLTGVQWTNLAFIAAACVGAVFSVVYLFDGELVQEVARWPRELFHGRAVSPAQSPSRYDSAVGQNGKTAFGGGNVDSGDPFADFSTSLRLERPSRTRPNHNRSSPFAMATSALRSLNGSDTAETEPIVPNVSSTSEAAPSGASTSAVPTGQTSAITAPAVEQPGSTVKSSAAAVKSTAARAAATANRVSAVRTSNRSSRTIHATRAAKNTKTSFFRSLFGPRPARTAASTRKTAANRSKTTATARSIKTAKQETRRTVAQRSQVTGRQKIVSNQSSLGKVSAKATTARKTAAGRKSTTVSAIMLRSESSRLPQSVHSSGSASFRSATPGGINGGAAGLRSFGGGMGSSGIGGGLGAGHGFGRGR